MPQRKRLGVILGPATTEYRSKIVQVAQEFALEPEIGYAGERGSNRLPPPVYPDHFTIRPILPLQDP